MRNGEAPWSNGIRRKPQQRRSSEKVKRILTATEDLLEEKPRDEITVRLITDRSGVAAATFYGYFQDRDAAITTLEMRYIAEAHQVIADILARSDFVSWRDAVRGVYDAYVEWFRDNPAFRVLWYSGHLDKDVHAADRHLKADIAMRTRELLERNGARSDVPDLVYRFAADMIEKLLGHGFAEQADGDPARLGEGLTAAIAYLAIYLD